MESTVIRFLLAVISRLPLRVARALGAIIGQLAWLCRSRGAKTTLINLKNCFPQMSERDRKALAARSMRHWGMTVLEIPVVWHRGKDSLALIRSVKGMDSIEAALAEGRGLMMVSPHHGNWEVVGYWVATLGPLTTLYQPPRRFDLDDLLQHVRAKTGATLVPTNVRGVASLIKALKQGQLVGILPDMEPELNSGVFADFFGVPALTMTLIHSLQQKSNAAVLIGVAQRVPGGFDIIFIDPGRDIASADAATSATAMNRAIENLVTLAPEQYQWEYKRFKRRPEGMVRLYD
ncbi:MAG: lysophospholipid acyltransferase family protein [Porticoccaceae bacterium]